MELTTASDHKGDPDLESLVDNKPHSPSNRSKWKRKLLVTLALTILTSSQAILIAWSKRAGKFDYSFTTANLSVEALKCLISISVLGRIWRIEGFTEDNRLGASPKEMLLYAVPAFVYLSKNLLQYKIFAHVDAPGYQILKNLNIISTGVLYRIILKKKLSNIQWAAFILLCAGCMTAQLNSSSDRVLRTSFQGWIIAIAIAFLSGIGGIWTEGIMKRRRSRNVNVENFWLYIFGVLLSAATVVFSDLEAVATRGFFHGYSPVTVAVIVNHALSGIAVSMVLKYADNIAKVYSTSVAMILTAAVSAFLFHFRPSLAFLLGATIISVSLYLHKAAPPPRSPP